MRASRGVLLAFVATAASSLSAVEELSTIVLIRHGEKTEASGNALSPSGAARALYIAQCLGDGVPTAATPLGSVRSIMASRTREGKSHRTFDTVAPLAAARNLPVHASIDKRDSEELVRTARRHLHDGGALVVAWQHDELPNLIYALAPDLHLHHAYKEWPVECDSPTWAEPEGLKGHGRCYDLVWQLTLRRQAGQGPEGWTAISAQTLHMGFGGSATSPCVEGFAPLPPIDDAEGEGESDEQAPPSRSRLTLRPSRAQPAGQAPDADEGGEGASDGANWSLAAARLLGGVRP
jgi:hypothetical protein